MRLINKEHIRFKRAFMTSEFDLPVNPLENCQDQILASITRVLLENCCSVQDFGLHFLSTIFHSPFTPIQQPMRSEGSGEI